jgi:hypothetical protein
MVHISIANAADSKKWEKDISQEDYNKIKGYDGEPGCFVLYGLAVPIRTNNLKNLATDLFLPTTLNYAVKLEMTILKVLAIVASLFIDLLTLPIRCLTLIPRIITNYFKENNPMYQYLSNAGMDKDLLNEDFVKVQFETSSSNGKSKSTKINNIAFVEMPGYDHVLSLSTWKGSL